MSRNLRNEQVNLVGKTSWGLGVDPPATGGQREFEGGAPNAARFFQLFPKNKSSLSIFWSKFLLKLSF